MSKFAFRSFIFRLLLAASIVCTAGAQPAAQHYALILDDSPVAERFASRAQAESDVARNYRLQVQLKQQAVRSQLATRNIQVLASVSTLMNAVFVVASPDRVAELRAMPGIKGVVAGRRYHAKLNRAMQLVNAPVAWNNLGGAQNAGTGIKIAIIDNGIDQTHPAFNDTSFKTPAGYPICKVTYPGGTVTDLANCSAFTNNKVIVARSYIPVLAAGSDPSNPAADSRPDDYLPRDRAGHGTAVASAAAAVTNTSPTGITLNGVAPKAYLGSYKIFGSPQVNDFATDSVIILALEDALNDHMDIAALSLGGAALTGPLDTGAACGNAPGVACDLVPQAVESAVKAGMVVVIAAGNDGDGASSYNAPTLSSIESPGDSPSAITVGSSTNSHYLVEGVEVAGDNVPSNLQKIEGALGDGVFPPGALAGTLRDVSQLGDDGLACSALPARSLAGSIALIQRGTCTFLVKVITAQNAGAAGVVMYMADQSPLIAPASLTATSIPVIMIANADGLALKAFIAANPGQTVLIDPAAFEQSKSSFNLLSSFSSIGPTTGDNAIKPDLVATGGSEVFFTDMYLATQSFDPLGDMYSANRYTAGSGTSFATPIVAGAAALVKQAHPNFTPAQIKSALVNTAAQDVTSDERGSTVSVQSVGAGKLDAGAATQVNVTSDTPSLSFGIVTALPVTKQVQFTNAGSTTANLSLSVVPGTSAAAASLSLDKQTLSLAPGASGSVNVLLSGSVPSAGVYSGTISAQGGGPTLRIPYLFLVGNGRVDNFIVLTSPTDALPGQDAGPLAVRLIDSNGAPVAGAAVTFTASTGATLKNIQSTTNKYGIATAEAFLGSQPGSYDFTASAGGMALDFRVNAMRQPSIAANGVVDGATFAPGKPVAPGSLVSIFGNDLSNNARGANSASLPLTLARVTVSFDVPSAKLSLPGHLLYVSPNQVNVQVPWELQGQTAVQVKVTVSDGFGFAYGNVVTVPLADAAPAFFEIGGQVAARDLGFNMVGPGNPARRGQTLQLYANGLGAVDGQPASGDPAVVFPLANCKSQAKVTIGTQPADMQFCGLAPGFAGLYQLNVVVPPTLAPGTYPITVAIGGQTSKASSLIVQ